MKKNEKKFRHLFENKLAYCYMVSPQGKIIDINKMALKVLGYKKPEVIGEPLVIHKAVSSWKEARDNVANLLQICGLSPDFSRRYPMA